ncbi:MAG: quinolinate synthase NadA [Syntrophaceae bacterium]|nr:quinolinate synthase NadA [Syntrophaceae bacterium]
MELVEKTLGLKRKQNAVILAHNYQIPAVQDIADYVGDSLGLSIQAAELLQEISSLKSIMDRNRWNVITDIDSEALTTGTGFLDKILLSSGRISSEILSKVLRCRMPVIVAVGAPTNQTVKLARHANLTLVGRIRGDRMNVYSGEERIC